MSAMRENDPESPPDGIIEADRPAEEGQEPALQKPSISVHFDSGTERIEISAISARALLALCDKVVLQGSAAKFQLGVAQQELETGLTALAPPKEPHIRLSRAQRRQIEHSH